MEIGYSIHDKTTTERTEIAFRRLRRCLDLAKQNKFSSDGTFDFLYISILCGTLLPGNLNYGMFKTVIELLGSDEQRAYYLPLTQDFLIHGWYAQTEFGHGSDVAMLETVAEFDEATDSFIINSPTITSGKWWPGELGKVATHAVFHAQLRIKGEPYGVHAFLCQIRNMDSHMPLKGIEVGEIGPKSGYQDKDNGYLYFKNFMIPRSSLLSRYVQVDKEGNFSISGNPRFAYATMMKTRIGIIASCHFILNKALLIGTRYSIYRKQFKTLENGKIERKIIDYQAQQSSLISILAFSISVLFLKRTMYSQFDEMMNQIQTKNDFKMLKELHWLLSWIKAFVTEDTLGYLKTIRELCGAQGFIQTSNLPFLVDIASPYVTLEGDNYVMYQQTSRIIIKAVADVIRGKEAKGNLEYLNDIASYNKHSLHKFDPNDREQLLDMLKANALYYISRSALLMRDDKNSFESKWNLIYQNDIVKLSQAHAAYLICLEFVKNLENVKISENLRSHLNTLCNIHIANTILKYADGAILSKFAKAKHLALVEDYLYEQIELFRPQLLNILESWKLPEIILHSIIGSDKGKVYETLFQASSESKLNNKSSLDSTFKYLKPLSQRLSARM